MKQLLTTLALVIATSMVGQSKKEYQQLLFEAERTITQKDYQLQELNKKYDILTRRLKSLGQSKESMTSIIKILPYLNVSDGFPEKFYPSRDNIALHNEVYSLNQENKKSDSTIVGYERSVKFPTLYPGSPDTVVLLGVIDTTLFENHSNVIYGTVPVLYKNKIWFTTFFDLYGSDAVQDLKRDFKKGLLIDEFGEEIGQKLSRGIPWIGMSDSQLIAMFGFPDDRTSYQSADGIIYTYTYEKGYRTYRMKIIDYKVADISRY